jgi:hypothetical protein
MVPRDGTYHNGDMRMMNVQVDDSKTYIYSRTFDPKRKSWEIIRAPVSTRPRFESYFRTYETFEWNECDFNCCGDTGHTYIQVSPKSYLADGNDVFISWDGFYKDCTDVYSASKVALWTIGISKLKKDAECIMTEGDERVNFATCTEPVSIVYQNATGRSRVVPYGGFTVARSPTGSRMFFLSILLSTGIDTGKVTSEVWISPEGAKYSRSSKDLQTIGALQVSSDVFDGAVEEVGTLCLHLNKEGLPDHLCRTAFNAGIYCFPITMQEDGAVHITEESREFVSSQQVNETCFFPQLQNNPWLAGVSTIATGLKSAMGY